MSLVPFFLSTVRERGPLTVAAYMDLALYHPEHGYYARAARRSGRDGDFFTSVDAGPLFGELIAVQLDEMWRLLHARGASHFDLVEVGAGDGRLARAILDAAERYHPDLYGHTRLTLVERSAAAAEAQRETLGPHAHVLAATGTDLPLSVTGVILANELLDAFPVHVVTMTRSGLREIHVAARDGNLVEIDLALSDPSIDEYLERSGVTPEIGARAEVGLAAVDWIARAAGTLTLGFLLLFDYGYEATELYSSGHSRGTLMAYRGHTAAAIPWLALPGESDLTSHVNFTAIRDAAEGAGLATLGVTDQTYFLTALGLVERLDTGSDPCAVGRRLSAKTLIMPGGLGSTMKVIVFARNAGAPHLRGLAARRVT